MLQKYFLIFLLLGSNHIFAQSKKLDSLISQKQKFKIEDTNYVKLLIEIGQISLLNDPTKTLATAKELETLGNKLQFPKAIFGSMTLQANYFQKILKIDSAIWAYDKAKNYALLSNNKIYEAIVQGNMASIQLLQGKTALAIENLIQTIANLQALKEEQTAGKLMINLANAYNVTGQRVLSLQTALQALTINLKYKDANIISANNYLIGSLYGISAQFIEALKYHKDYAAIQTKLENWENVCSGLMAVANDYKQLKKTDSATSNLQQAMVIAKKNQLTEIENKIKQILNTEQNKQEKEAEDIAELHRLKKSYEASGMQQDLGNVLNKLATKYSKASSSYLQKNNLTEASKNELVESYLTQIMDIGKSSNNYGLIEEANRSLSAFYETQNNFTKAYTYFKNYITLRDSAINDSRQVEIAKLNLQFTFNKAADSLKLKQAIIKAALQKQSFLNAQQQTNLLLQDKELLLNKQTILNGNQQMSILNKDKELQHLEYLKTQAELQSTQLAKSEKQKQLTLSEKEKQLATAQVASLNKENENNILKRKQLVEYGIALLLSLLLATFYVYKQNEYKQLRLQTELTRQKAEQDLVIAKQQTKAIELQKNLTDATLSALRSQMNPHFIFNSLNSINSVVIEGNIPLASDYLTKFSKLIRLILENSKNALIPLSKELEAISLYLLMEKMRFQKKFEYEINIDKNTQTDKLFIPPTTLQPFVENAILHGIMHLDGNGLISIDVKNKDNHFLEIFITDNGVGRKKASELKSRTNLNKSHGLSITKQRITELHVQNNIEIMDKVDSNLKAIGTTIKITLHF